MYADPDLRAQRQPGRIADAMIVKVGQALSQIRWARRDIAQFLGRYLTEPKPHVFFSPPRPALSLPAFRRGALQAGVCLELRTQMLYAGSRFFINGESTQARGEAARCLRHLADHRSLRLPAPPQTDLVQRLHGWYTAGYLRVGRPEEGP
jgi:50S ribosomal protein L16 3-hydroxylase